MLPAGLLAGGAVLYLSSRQGQATTGAAPSPASGQGGLFGSSPLSLSINVPSGSQVPAIPSVPDLTKVAASVLPQAPAIPSVPDLTKVAASVLPQAPAIPSVPDLTK
ncbi:MAG: hypothetical protein HY532_00525, partial [Chloroflexi bacterium]|nr:hypothetical protein [Chloroflexota bacterium]